MYDPAILKEFASRMYSRAAAVVFTWTFLGILVGLLVGLLFGAAGVTALGQYKLVVSKDAGMIFVIVGGAIGGGLGFAIGSEKAFWMRLEAQKVLCMLQTEVNTRKPLAPKALPPTDQPDEPNV